MIKKTKDKNEYLFAEGIWVRNFAIKAPPIDINELVDTTDYNLLVSNEYNNMTLELPNVENENDIIFNKVVIISDGFNFENKQELLADIPKNVAIFATNRAVIKWKLNKAGRNKIRNINLFIVNNPYSECIRLLPSLSKYYPACILSSRTCYEFVNKYPGVKYEYNPTPSNKFKSPIKKQGNFYVDDYRNPICASIILANKFKAQKLLLFCCDDSFADDRPGSVKLNNGFYTYPQHVISQKIIDANLYWLRTVGKIEICNHSNGIDYINAPYISSEKIIDFFGDKNE